MLHVPDYEDRLPHDLHAPFDRVHLVHGKLESLLCWYLALGEGIVLIAPKACKPKIGVVCKVITAVVLLPYRLSTGEILN